MVITSHKRNALIILALISIVLFYHSCASTSTNSSSVPNVSGSWFAEGNGMLVLTQKGDKLSGTAEPVHPGDYWGQGHRNGGNVTGSISDDGKIVICYAWGDGTYSEDIMQLSKDGNVMNGTWNWYTNQSKTTSNGSGQYSLIKK